MSEYLNLENQILYLFKEKSVMFEEGKWSEVNKCLRDSNYRNLISCSKIRFAENKVGKITYVTATFKEWLDYFETDRKVSKHLMNNLIDFELTLNSRVSHHICEMMHEGQLSNFEHNAVIQIISQMRDRKNIRFSEYDGRYTWKFVHKMTFGEMKKLLFWLYETKPKAYLEVIEGYSFLNKQSKNRINEINNLRNSLFHFMPLTIYLVRRKYRNKMISDKERQKIVKWIGNFKTYQNMASSLEEICANTMRYIEIKKQSTK